MNEPPQSPKKKYNLRKRRHQKYSDSETDSDEDDSDYIPENSDSHDSDHDNSEAEEFDLQEWQKFLGKMFPSKYTAQRNKKIECFEKLKNGGKKKKKKKKKQKQRRESKEESEDDIQSDDSEDHEEDNAILMKMWEEEDRDPFEDGAEENFLNNPNMKVNVIFTVAENPLSYESYDEEEGQEEDEDKEELEDEDEIEEIITKSSNNKKTKKNNPKKQNYKKGDKIEIKIDKKWIEGEIIKDNGNDTYKVKAAQKLHSKIAKKNIRYLSDQKILDELKMLIEAKKNGGGNSMLKKFGELVKAQDKKNAKKLKEEEKKQKITNMKLYRKLLHTKNIMCDYKYFRNLSPSKQSIILEQMKDIQKHSQLKKPYRISLLESDMPIEYKVAAFNKINTLAYMDRAGGEYYKIKQWVDTFMQLPFGKYTSLPIQINDGQEKCQEFMEDARQRLDDAVYGLEDAKMQIMQMIGQWISNPKSVGTAIAIHGPMGTGKTTLVKEGISKILNRPFTFIALGGATDSSFLEGHSYTYEGSSWGKIVDILIQSKCMNPVIYFDELDKVSETPKGEEIIGILTHLTDTTQNPQYHDKYFSGLDFDLSKALFIFSYNDDKKINPVLRDRMYTIETKGYNTKQKTVIAQNYLIPAIEKNVSFEKGQIIIPQDTLEYLITNYTKAEKGVRNLKRCLEIIYTKLNLFRLMKPDSSLFDTKMTSLNVNFPYTVRNDIIPKLIKQQESNIPHHLYI